MSIPKSMQETYAKIEPLITGYCDQCLNEDYKVLCLRLLEKLCRKRPSPLLSGRANTWAAGIVYAIATNNFIFDKSQPIHHTADELCAPFGLAKSTVANKANEINRLCSISRLDPQWMLPHLIDSNPAVWFLYVNDYLIDIRHAPLEIQIQAYEKGLIPYVPAIKEAERQAAQAAAEAVQIKENDKQEETKEASPSSDTPKEPIQDDFSDIYQSFQT